MKPIELPDRHPYLTTLLGLGLIVSAAAVPMYLSQRTDRNLSLQNEQTLVLAQQEAETRAAAVVAACELFAARVDLTFQEVFDYISDRTVELGRPAPPALQVLSDIAARNLDAQFCRPPELTDPAPPAEQETGT